jgi:plastocyanin
MRSMRRRIRVLVPAALAALALLAVSSPAQAAVAAAGPGASSTGFATRVVVAPVGADVTFVNGDLVDHTLTSEALLPKKVAKKTPRCKPYGAKRCPLFDSGTVPPGMANELDGLERIVPGTEYPFVCRLHSGMTGTLIAVGP